MVFKHHASLLFLGNLYKEIMKNEYRIHLPPWWPIQRTFLIQKSGIVGLGVIVGCWVGGHFWTPFFKREIQGYFP